MNTRERFLTSIKQTVQALDPQAEIILYGSRARGDARDDSDWDVLILVPYAVDLQEEQRFRHKLFDLELQYGQVISTHVTSIQEWNDRRSASPMYQHIFREGLRI